MGVSGGSITREGTNRNGAHLTIVVPGDAILATQGLAQLAASDSTLKVVSSPATGEDILAACRACMPCVLVVDEPILAGINGEMERAADVGSAIRVLIVLDRDDPAASQRCLKLGFSGVVLRDASAEVFRRALDAVAKGELWASRQSMAELVRDLLSKANPRKLTSREVQILKLIASGFSNQQVADCLYVTRDTVRWHLKSIYSKLGANDRQQAIDRALKAGILVLSKVARPETGSQQRRKSVSLD